MINKSYFINFFKILSYLLSWFIFPPIYIWLLVKNKGIKKWQKIFGYLLVIISPFTLILVFLIGFSIIFYKPPRFSVFHVEDTIGIDLPFWSKINKNKITHNRQDFVAEVELEFNKKQLKKIIHQIEESPYYNHQFDNYYEDENEKPVGDSLAYWTLRNHLENTGLTGYWIKEDSVTFFFKEPNLSDIPNAAILFNEGYSVTARLNTQRRILKYKYSKL
jgi:hypothetical protein